MHDLYTALHRRVWSTRYTRFEAYRRNEKLHNLSTSGISIISAGTVLLTTYCYMIDNSVLVDNLGFLGVSASLFTLILGLIDGSKEFSLKSYIFHQCGLELSTIYDRINLSISLQKFDESDYIDLCKVYEEVINKYQLNHDQCDYDLFKLKNEKEFYPNTSEYEINFRKVLLFLSNYTLYYLLIILPFLCSAVWIYSLK